MDNSELVYASTLSKGTSGSSIYQGISDIMTSLNLKEQPELIDIGCGTGELLVKLKENFPQAVMTGVDLQCFSGFPSHITFHQRNLNEEFYQGLSSYDVVLASEVIEHLENPRHFVRSLVRIVKPSGYLVLSTPNLESITSIISYILRGYHSAFGPKDYPAHITPLSVYDFKNIVEEVPDLKLLKLQFLKNGRIPGSSLKWHKLFPFLKGKRFADNYLIVCRRDL